MIDHPDRPMPRFPAAAEQAARAALEETLTRLAPAAAIASAACGGDILFAEAVIERGAPLYVILPFEDRADFVARSVRYAGPDWEQRFQQVCERATALPYFVKGGGYHNDGDFEDNQRALIFFALGFAAARNMRLVCVVLFDEEQLGTRVGGTRSFLELCHELHIPYEMIDIAAIRHEVAAHEVGKQC
jgi:hypothetical protein